jgi:arsenite methyltransferase
MKKISTLFISGLIALCFSMSLNAQSSQQDLDQAELMKQFIGIIGTWGSDKSYEKTSLTEIIPSHQGYEMITYKKATGVNLWTGKAIFGFDQEYQMVIMFSLTRIGMLGGRFVGKFVSDKKLTMESDFSNPTRMTETFELSFLTPDKFDLILEWGHGEPETWDVANVEKSTYKRIKEDVKGQETPRAPATQQKFDNIDEWIEAFRVPRRDEWQKPEEVLKSLNLKPGDVVVDIGAGSGYFTRYFVKAVGPGGKALGLDINSSAVQYMKYVADKLESNIYEAHLVKPDNPELEPGSVDVVFMCITYHDMENRVDYLKRLSTSLKKNGRVVIVDWYNKTLPKGFPSVGHGLSKEAVIEEFREAGYNLTQDKDFLQYQYYLEFEL